MPSRRTRRLLPVLALSLTLSLTAVGTTNAGEAPDRDAPSSANPATGPAQVDPAAPAATLQTTAFTAGKSCTRVPAGTHPEAPEAVTACVSVESSPAKAGTLPRTQATSASTAPDTTTPARSTTTHTEGGTAGTRSLAAEADEADDPAGDGLGTEFEPDADDPEPPAATCQVTNPGTWTWSRTGGMCLNGAEVTYKLLDSRGAEIGSGLISVNSTLSTSYKSLDVTETITAKVIRVTGDVQSLTLRMQVGCGTGCTTVTKQPWYATTLSYNGEVTGKTKYRGDPFATGKTRVSFRTNYAMYVTMPGANPVDSSATWSSPAGGEIRCDAEQPRLRGCVIPTNDLPVLSYSRSHEKYGIVVPIYEEIMRRRGTDILHAVDLTQATANRNATCTPFTNLYPTTRGADSCDEFPPASTKEGGQDGSLCAELTPQVVNNVWSAPATWPNRPTTGTETCLRLHITQRANSSAGGVLGSLRKYQRLVTDDPFRIEFTS
ncbi:hypothetical protein GCM10018777_61380 [Streptomyces albogriseolus]|uniref:NucA/NucB deoxyribonuclease domain-containing protein n=1 Tax=Streptomyces albogriseolus TaxID=1887 RepID=UPI0019C3CAF4|nr:hypothetical protein [Streptomyces viridodiastaticus]GHG36406.1 hypothetical protein GCM10018777_61380 [Streptomyces viridodiastaticus]